MSTAKIDSAPTDIRIMLYSPANGGMWFIGRWHDDRYAKTPRPFFSFEGQQTSFCRAHQPTHWRPLPSEPEGME